MGDLALAEGTDLFDARRLAVAQAYPGVELLLFEIRLLLSKFFSIG
jgi:hypothetical protein